MTALLRKFPDLALHLTDHTRTPILSSASTLNGQNDYSYNGKDGDERHDQAMQRLPTHDQRAQALDCLADTALRARDAAARLGLGLGNTQWADSGITPPECIVVSYNTGVVLVERFLDSRQPQKYSPQSCPGYNPGHTPRRVVSGPVWRPAPGPNSTSCRTGLSNRSNAITDGNEGHLGVNNAPLILGLVVAPGPQALKEAHRASAQLERLGRAVQQELADGERRQG